MIASPALQTSKRTAAAVAASQSVAPSVAPRSTVTRVRTASATPALSAIERTLHTLLAPLEFEDWKSWQREVHARLIELTGADTLCMYTPMAKGFDAWISPHVSNETLLQYAQRAAADANWDVIERSFERFAGPNGEGVAHESELLPRRTLEASAFYQEFLLPNRILDLTVVGTAFGGTGAARLHFSNHKRQSAAVTEERQSLIRTVLPAFRSGLAQWRQVGERRLDFGRMLDVMADAVLLYDMSGNLVHANPSAAALLGSAAPLTGTESDRLQIEAQRVAWSMGALSRRTSGSLIGTPGLITAATTLPSATRELKVNGQSYTLRGSLAPAWMLGRDPGVIVTVEATSAKSTSDADLRERFGLTTREVEVARLVASGLSNQALAEKLGVSFFTARNHVERLMGKMSAMNRAHIGALVRGDQTVS